MRRFHGGGRHLDELAADEIVLATYGMMRRDAAPARRDQLGPGRRRRGPARQEPRVAHRREALRAIPAPARVALTGTPVENHLSELWAILDWTTPGLLGTLAAFRRRYAVPIERDRDAEATARLAALVRPFLLRRRKTDPGIAPELPPKTETDQPVPLTAEQVSLYEAVVRETHGGDRRRPRASAGAAWC